MIDGRYQIEAELGSGAMGRALQVFDTKLKRRVALKQLNLENREARRRLANEARAAAKLQSEHVAHVLDAQVDSHGDAYIVMELLSGRDLKALIRDEGRMDPARAANYVAQACDALQEAHSHGIVHRDIKPSNLFLAKRHDGTHTIKVLDFGISKANLDEEGAEETAQFTIVGTPRYIAPERLRWDYEADARTDIWGLGIVLYELLVGQPPFAGDNGVSLITQIATTDAAEVRSKRPELSPQINAIVRRCLRREPKQRYSSVSELKVALQAFAQTGVGQTRVESASDRAAETTNRVQLLAARLPTLPSSGSWFQKAMVTLGVAALGIIAWRLSSAPATMALSAPSVNTSSVQAAAPSSFDPSNAVAKATTSTSPSSPPAPALEARATHTAAPAPDAKNTGARVDGQSGSIAVRSVESLPLEDASDAPSDERASSKVAGRSKSSARAGTKPASARSKSHKSASREIKREPTRRGSRAGDPASPAGSGSDLFSDIR